MRLWWLALLLGLLSLEPAFAQADPYGGDPFQTFQRPDLKKEFVRNAPTTFDAIRVQPSRRALLLLDGFQCALACRRRSARRKSWA